jgi:hypothetical protein
MRLRWVGDARDYVKWDCVVEHANGRYVFYVPMLRSSVDPACKHSVVQDHFDRRKNLDQFQELFPERFAVFIFPLKEYSKKNADEYFFSVKSRINELPRAKGLLVFIDPDTGIEPVSGAHEEHLRARDIRSVWESLLQGDKLVIYQHASRAEGWREKLRRRASEILEIELNSISEPYFDETLAKDVCFLVLEKS